MIQLENERILFTKEMKKDYTLLMPNMLPVHFKLFKKVFEQEGYNIELLTTSGRSIVNEGLKNVHNDTCYPALLVIGQMIDALKSGKYDLNKVALMITQTGGGCRASNYIHLLRKALIKSGYAHIPVVSLNLSGMEKNPGFKLTLPMLKQMIYGTVYADLFMLLANQTRPYEVNKGESDELINKWAHIIGKEFKYPKNATHKRIKENFDVIIKSFADVPVVKTDKIKVGVVGEIYVKYAPLGNNNLEQFLRNEEVEVVVPGLLDFVIFKADNRTSDADIYGGSLIKKVAVGKFKDFMITLQDELISAIEKYPQFSPPAKFEETKKLVKNYMGYGNKMGEGWLLTGEMLELIHSGTNNIVCTQPFGCLPNHIAGKGMLKKIKEENPTANIVAIDYDPGATAINQENRIKLMIANGKRIHKMKSENKS